MGCILAIFDAICRIAPEEGSHFCTLLQGSAGIQATVVDGNNQQILII
jgi:hypothetical protein